MQARLHAVDLIRKTRDREALSAREIAFLVQGAASGTIPDAQLASWLMAVFQQGLTHEELSTLTESMRVSGGTFDARDHTSSTRKRTVDKHSTGGVGDKTSLIVAPIAAAAGLLDPMISGRALGHTGGTLDKLESIPGFRVDLSLDAMGRVLRETGACLVGQTAALAPADRTFYALRDQTATVESPYLICASIMSKKLAAGLDGLVLDVKTGSGAFIQSPAQARFLAGLLVETGERSGTRTAALLTDMSQPLGSAAGNWIEVAECCSMLQGERAPITDDLRRLSLELAAWMLLLGGVEPTLTASRDRAEALLTSGEAWKCFRAIVQAQGGDLHVLDGHPDHHAPGATKIFRAEKAGYLGSMDATAIGWAVQRLGAGRARAGENVDPHAGLHMHAKLGERVEWDAPLCTLYAANEALFPPAIALLTDALAITDAQQPVPPLFGEVVASPELLAKA